MLTPSLPRAQFYMWSYENEDFDQIIVGKFSIYLGSGTTLFCTVRICLPKYSGWSEKSLYFSGQRLLGNRNLSAGTESTC